MKTTKTASGSSSGRGTPGTRATTTPAATRSAGRGSRSARARTSSPAVTARSARTSSMMFMRTWNALGRLVLPELLLHLGRERGDVGQVPEAPGEVEPVADHEPVLDREALVVDGHVAPAPGGLVEERA